MNYPADAASEIFQNFSLYQILLIRDQLDKFGKGFVGQLKQKLQ